MGILRSESSEEVAIWPNAAFDQRQPAMDWFSWVRNYILPDLLSLLSDS